MDFLNYDGIYKECLFNRGFLYVSRPVLNSQFLSDWNQRESEYGGIYYFHKNTEFCIRENADSEVVLIGHAYNPFKMIYRENDLINELFSRGGGIDDCLKEINEWTGLFVLIIKSKESTIVIGDCCGMQSVYYGVVDGVVCITSHAQIVGDLFNLQQSKYVIKMKKYKFWQKYGNFLPGDISQFDCIKRLVPNTYVKIVKTEVDVIRFFPNSDHDVVVTPVDYNKTIDKIATIMANNLKLIALKWEKPAISMTGGMDSKTTVACAKNVYDKYAFYSYISMLGDEPDAKAASKIANEIDVKHNIYKISDNDEDFSQIDELRSVLEHNYGHIGKVNTNDVRKRAFFFLNKKFDVEVKSWVSEVGRANYYKKFGVKKMPKKLSPRAMTTLYKFFTYNRIDAIKTDRIFKEYIKKTKFGNLYNYDPSDMYLWEFRYGAWGGLVLTAEHRVSYDITIPYNNRILINEFLKIPLDKRIKDIPHYDIIKLMNKKIDDLGITIVNWNETKKRQILEKMYWYLNRVII